MYFLEKESYTGLFVLGVFSILSLVLSVWLLIVNGGLMIEWVILSSVGVGMLFSFYIDWMSLVFFSLISLISSAIFLYSGSYMGRGPKVRMFMILVSLFVVSMFFFVFSLNLVSMMLGWDGLGVISYILVIFYNNEKSNSAGMITSLSNRIGDAALLLCIACFLEFGSWNYMFFDPPLGSYFCWLVVLAAITKSAQMPFSAWLPAAMAAPTPVSALVHSSTLVTAGVYLLIRFNDLLASSVMGFLFYLGMLTTVMASLSALYEVDFKKVVALSTLSQLGIMVSTLSLGFEKLAFIHLLTHAVFKALLFMCSGKIIHSFESGQDIRKMGGVLFNLPITSVVMSLASFSLCGVPFLAGFYSKDLIIESSVALDNFFFNYIMYLLVVGLSASYSFRLLVGGGVDLAGFKGVYGGVEEDWVMLSSKLLLVIMSVVSGALLIWVGLDVPIMVSLNLGLKWLAFSSMCMGFIIGLILCSSPYSGLLMSGVLNFSDMFMMMWNLPILSGSMLGLRMIESSVSLKKLDLGWLESFGGQGVSYLLGRGSGGWEIWLANSVKKILVIIFLMVVIYFITLV